MGPGVAKERNDPGCGYAQAQWSLYTLPRLMMQAVLLRNALPWSLGLCLSSSVVGFPLHLHVASSKETSFIEIERVYLESLCILTMDHM